jgi:hypothetical protein
MVASAWLPEDATSKAVAAATAAAEEALFRRYFPDFLRFKESVGVEFSREEDDHRDDADTDAKFVEAEIARQAPRQLAEGREKRFAAPRHLLTDVGAMASTDAASSPTADRRGGTRSRRNEHLDGGLAKRALIVLASRKEYGATRSLP